MAVRLHVNVDHVATLRQARGTDYPDPVEAAMRCEWAGAHGITVHLREDRRHIQLRDVEILRHTVKTMLNLEIAATEEMVSVALRVKPDLVTLVPERREERTTEGGLDVAGQLEVIREICARLDESRIPVSLFIDPEDTQVEASVEVGAASIELHTGDFAEAFQRGDATNELERVAKAASLARSRSASLKIAAGHGLTARNLVSLLGRVPEIIELNIGHALVSDAVFVGLDGAIARFLRAMEEGEATR